MERGVIDPAKVVRVTLANASAIAGTLITTQVAVAEERSREGGGKAMA